MSASVLGCSPCVYWVLSWFWHPPAVQKYTCKVNWKLWTALWSVEWSRYWKRIKDLSETISGVCSPQSRLDHLPGVGQGHLQSSLQRLLLSLQPHEQKQSARLDGRHTFFLISGEGVNDFLTKPAWKDAEGVTTFCADTEVGIRWAELQRERKRRWGGWFLDFFSRLLSTF